MKSVFSLFSLLCFFSATAQFSLGANIKVYQPVGDFNQHLGTMPVGISFSAIKRTQSRFSFGGELGVAMYAAGDYDYDLAAYGRPGESIEVYEDNCFWTVHAFTRYSLFKTNVVEGYAEGRVGITTFFTNQMALEENSYFDSKTRFHGTAFNSGLGSGLSINPKRMFSESVGSAWIDLGVNLNSGSNSSYRNAPAISQKYSIEEGIFESLTSYVGYRIGVIIDL